MNSVVNKFFFFRGPGILPGIWQHFCSGERYEIPARIQQFHKGRVWRGIIPEMVLKWWVFSVSQISFPLFFLSSLLLVGLASRLSRVGDEEESPLFPFWREVARKTFPWGVFGLSRQVEAISQTPSLRGEEGDTFWPFCGGGRGGGTSFWFMGDFPCKEGGLQCTRKKWALFSLQNIPSFRKRKTRTNGFPVFLFPEKGSVA